MQTYIPRLVQKETKECLCDFPVVTILGPRQCGKSTLAHHISSKFKNTIYLDLEKPSDLRKLEEAELYLQTHSDQMICLDEIQRKPDLFPVLRSLIDEKKKKGRFLILGSASRDLISQSSETLAGRIAYIELTPFLYPEISQKSKSIKNLFRLWIRGGFPESFLARNEISSIRWRENFIRTFLERDIPQLGFRIPVKSIQRLWGMLAHNHGQIINSSRIGESIGASHITIRSYIDLLVQTFMVRVLPPHEPNLKKRLIKSPKVYIRDSGILHTLLEIEDFDNLMGHPVYGASWEGFVIENIISKLPKWNASFYRTSSGTEVDLILQKGKKKIAVECKASTAPQVSKGFWNALKDLAINEAWIISPVKEEYPVKKNVKVSPLETFLNTYG
ncbi:MAG: ATP-binding protein [Candidatus Brocadiaceae bacterium]|nr:ATP-binding protein [Candidatus Brocadiaceae bacterium]